MLGGMVAGFRGGGTAQEGGGEAIRAGIVAEQVDALSILTISTPSGGVNSLVSEYCGSWTARFMNSAQMGAAACAPSIFTSV